MSAPTHTIRPDPLEVPWLTVCGDPDRELARTLTGRVKGLVQSGKFTWEDVRNIGALSARLVPGDLRLSAKRLELLRRMCQTWDIELRVSKITSHRPVIGPVIVLVKRVLFRLVHALFREVIEQQRDFNALLIAFLAGSERPAEPPREENGEE